MGAGLAHRLSTVGHDVWISNSRAPERLREVAMTDGACCLGDRAPRWMARVVVLAVPCFIIDAVEVTNFYLPRDGADLGPAPGDPRQRCSASPPERR
jgi:hypothetical protein